MDREIAPCGMDCRHCSFYPKDCAGCRAIQGKVYWLEYTGEPVCDIYDCCVDRKAYPHCGTCDELPCARFGRDDPTKSPEENEEDHRSMMETLIRLRKEELDHV